MAEKHTAPCAQKTGFNYCFWAKVLVAIPLFPLVALIAASQFDNELAQCVAAVVAVVAAVAISRWIDRIPALQKIIKPRKD